MTSIAIAYTRVSTENQEEFGRSLVEQKNMAKEYAEKNNLNIIKLFEEAHSALKPYGRPEFKAMLEYLKNNEVNDLIAESIDRLSRNPVDFHELMMIVKEKNITIHLVMEGKVITPNCTASEEFINDVTIAMAKYQANLSNEKSTRSLYGKAKDGGFPGKAPYGYKNKPGEIVIEETEASFVVEAFEIFSQGSFSLVDTSEELYNRGFIYKDESLKIPKTTLDAMLRRLFYIGKFVYGKNKEIYQGIHTPIVPQALFDKVQFVLETKVLQNYCKRNFLYNGLITCEECGSPVSGDIKKGKYTYYRCAKASNSCSQKSYAIETDIIKGIKNKLSCFDLALISQDEVKELTNQAICNDIAKLKNRIGCAKASILKTSSQRERALEKYIEGFIGENRLNQLNDKYAKRETYWQSELKRMQNELSSYENTSNKIAGTSLDLLKIYNNQPQKIKRELLRVLFDKITLLDKKLLFVEAVPLFK